MVACRLSHHVLEDPQADTFAWKVKIILRESGLWKDCPVILIFFFISHMHIQF